MSWAMRCNLASECRCLSCTLNVRFLYTESSIALAPCSQQSLEGAARGEGQSVALLYFGTRLIWYGVRTSNRRVFQPVVCAAATTSVLVLSQGALAAVYKSDSRPRVFHYVGAWWQVCQIPSARCLSISATIGQVTDSRFARLGESSSCLRAVRSIG